MVYTEFISSEGLIRDAAKSVLKLDIYEKERPVGIQIFGAKLDSMLTDREIIVEDVDSQMGPNADPEDASVRSNLENFGIDAFMLVFTFLLSSFPDLVFFCGLGHNQCLSAMPSRKNDSRKPRKESSRQLLKKKRR